MLQFVNTVTLLEANGRIWTERPPPGAQGLVTCFQTPSSSTSASVRALEFSICVLDSTAQHLAAVDSKGAVYVFNFRQNRYARLDRVGYPGTAAVFATDNLRQLFVAFAVRLSNATSSRNPQNLLSSELVT